MKRKRVTHRTSPTTMRRKVSGCPTPAKEAYSSEHWSMIAAKQVARHMIADGHHFDPLYAYRCSCGAFHLTRRESWNGVDNILVWRVDDKLQEWARRPRP